MMCRRSAVGGNLNFTVRVSDDSGAVGRVVVLYAAEGATSWSRVELPWNPADATATGSVPLPGPVVRYFVQAADGAGNVALALDAGDPYRVRRDHPARPPGGERARPVYPDLAARRLQWLRLRLRHRHLCSQPAATSLTARRMITGC